jgi:hypothetical protein
LPGAGVRGCRAIENQHQSRRKQARLGLTQIGQGGDKTRKKVQFCTCVWGKYFASVEAMPNSTLDCSLYLPLELRGDR